ncbi:hypothetical protein PBCVAN69C_725R [Paramecium bursaria Chlorella virus AN69C]|uniref:Uncharacterized protein n=1 Tax=Paramecium bursaria Chlorella virus IL3A TaxID=46019 RepID=M1HV40_PBCVI|nr:hypothetical protein PBCVAN69C_725R [Paramecium bursaria Chlorella virus AN69C]AGE54044.1 hypothetical protein PBCVIL3A_711R [Paramecium bursaria Chlorella virus IL3A]
MVNPTYNQSQLDQLIQEFTQFRSEQKAELSKQKTELSKQKNDHDAAIEKIHIRLDKMSSEIEEAKSDLETIYKSFLRQEKAPSVTSIRQ